MSTQLILILGNKHTTAVSTHNTTFYCPVHAEQNATLQLGSGHLGWCWTVSGFELYFYSLSLTINTSGRCYHSHGAVNKIGLRKMILPSQITQPVSSGIIISTQMFPPTLSLCHPVLSAQQEVPWVSVRGTRNKTSPETQRLRKLPGYI